MFNRIRTQGKSTPASGQVSAFAAKQTAPRSRGSVEARGTPIEVEMNAIVTTTRERSSSGESPEASRRSARESARESAHRLPSIEHLGCAERERLKVLPLAVRWMPPTVQKVLLALPENVAPREACAKHPVVIERLLAKWRDPIAFRAELERITIDDRSVRQGFSFPVMNELGLLGNYYDTFVFPQKKGAWANVDPY